MLPVEERVVVPAVKFSPPSPVMALGKVSPAPVERFKVTPVASAMEPVNVMGTGPLVAILYPVTLKFRAATIWLASKVTVPPVPPKIAVSADEMVACHPVFLPSGSEFHVEPAPEDIQVAVPPRFWPVFVSQYKGAAFVEVIKVNPSRAVTAPDFKAGGKFI